MSKKTLLVLLITALLPVVAQNLLENSSFETVDTQKGIPASWTVVKKGIIENTHSVDEATALDGKNAARIVNGTDMTKGVTLLYLQHLADKFAKVPAGTEVEFTVFARSTAGTSRARIYFEALKARKTVLKDFNINADEWTKLSVRFVKEDIDYGQPYVCIGLLKGGVLFDGAYFGPAGKSPYKINATSDDFILNPSAERITESGQPLHWKVLNRSKNGKAYVDSETVTTGKRALTLQCDGKPDGILAWNYKFPAGTFDEVKPQSEMLLTLKANTHGNPGTLFRFYVEFMHNGKFVGTRIAANQTIYVGWKEKTLRFKMPDVVPTVANLYVQLMGPGKVTFDDVSLKLADKAKPAGIELTSGDYCRISSKMPAMNTFTAPDSPKKITIEHFLSSPELKVELFEIDGPRIQEWQFKNLPIKKAGSLEVALPALQKGAYELVFTCGGFVDYEWFRIRDKQTRGAHFMENGILNLDGKPFFPIGIVTPENDMDVFRVYSESGINTVRGSVSTSEQMAKYTLDIYRHVRFACVEWNNWGLRKDMKEDVLRKKYAAQAAYLQNLNGFIGFLSDEAPWHPWDLASMRRHYKMMYKHLPDYVAWMNNAPRLTGDSPRESFASVRAYSRASDVTGLDIYPVPEGTGHNNLPNKTISCVGEYTDLCHKLTWNTKPVWMILQAFGWSESSGGKLNDKAPRPNEKQLRFMVWNAITHGATGIFWFGEGARDVYSDWWPHVAKVSLELKAISELMLAAPYHRIEGLPPKTSGIEGKGFKVVVNENPDKAVTWQGKTIEPQGVLFITDKPLDIPLPARFTRQKTEVKTNTGVSQKTVLLDANWTAHPEYLRGAEKTVYARHILNVDAPKVNAFVRSSVDDAATLYVNGAQVGEYTGHSHVTQFNISKYLRKGENVLTFEVVNATGPTGLVYEIEVNGKKYASGDDTMFSFDNKTNWKKAYSFGKPPIAPWKSPNMFIEK